MSKDFLLAVAKAKDGISQVSSDEWQATKDFLTSCWVTVLVMIVCLGCHLFPGMQGWMALHRESPSPMLLMQSLSCHLTHWSFDQLFWDVAAFGVLGYLCEIRGRKKFVSLLFSSGLVVSISVLLGHPEVITYRGMSGIDSALFVFLACLFAAEGLRKQDWRLVGGMLAWGIFVAKILFEMISAIPYSLIQQNSLRPCL